MNIHVNLPAESLDSFSINPATIQRPDENPLLSLARLRKEAEREVERLLNFLDLTDGFTFSELELNFGHQNAPDECEGADEDREPSLGSLEVYPSAPYRTQAEVNGWLDQSRFWSAGSLEDYEGCEHDGREPEDYGGEAVDEDDEPSLGWTAEEGNNGRGAAGCYGRGHDLEEQCEDEGANPDDEEHEPSGIADFEGMLEQLSGSPLAQGAMGVGAIGFARGVE